MTISGLFIKRPIMTTLVMTGILLFGIMGSRLLPVSDLANVDFPRRSAVPEAGGLTVREQPSKVLSVIVVKS